MPYRSVDFRAGHYYHVYNRGNNFQPIFFSRDNYLFFLRQLRHYLSPQAVTVVAYCLMPNHYHLLIYLQTDNLPKLMQPFVLSYTNAINKRFRRAGSLFQGRFKAIHVDRDEYLLHLSRYIHLNPVAAGLVRQPEAWEFSSYLEYLGLREGRVPQMEAVLSQFQSRDDYRRFVEGHIESDDEPIRHLLID